MYTKCQSSRALLYSVAKSFDEGTRSNRDASAIFLHSSRVAVQCADECIQLFGGNGYINEYPCGRLWRDAKINEIYGGTKEIRQWLIGRELMKEYGQ